MKNLNELQWEAENLRIPLSGTETKDLLMDLLAESHREHDITGSPPLLPQLQVMVARNVKDLKKDELDKMISSNLWVAETKLDGVRAKLHLGKNNNRIDSRHRSDVTYEYVEKTDCLPHLRDLTHNYAGTVLDGELVMPVEKVWRGKEYTDSYLTATTATVNSYPKRAIELQEKFGWCRYYVFDILFFCGADMRHMPYTKRYVELCLLKESLSYEMGGDFIKTPARHSVNIESFYNRLVAGGGEGVMLKHLDWPYESGKRSKGMYKWKKHQTIDAFVTGFVPGRGEFSGLIGALLVSVMAGSKQVEIGAVQPGDLTFRRRISEADGNLQDNMYGKVVEVSYLCKTKNNRLRHAVLKRFRPDKSCYDCTIEKGK